MSTMSDSNKRIEDVDDFDYKINAMTGMKKTHIH